MRLGPTVSERSPQGNSLRVWTSFSLLKVAPVFSFLAQALLICGPQIMPAQAADQLTRQEDINARMQFFETKIRPVLADNCHSCHGSEKQKGGLRLDLAAGLREGGDSGAVVEPGNPAGSLLLRAVRHIEPDLHMPPKSKLADHEIADLELWIAQGADWPETPEEKKQTAGMEKDKDGFTRVERDLWTFQPLATQPPPELSDSDLRDWADSPIDQFIAAKLGENGLKPAAAASPGELIKRLYQTLHGLPPPPDKAREFLANPTREAFAALVDELLASPRFGERMAQHWLDLVRYAESDGYNADGYRPDAWRYRDWVIRAFNEDMPYDRFVSLQLAADEISPDDPAELVAVSYLRNGIYEWNQRDVKGQWDLILNDMTDNAGEVFLGLSFACARCHDHKFDPVRQEDYYRLKAFFTPVLWEEGRTLSTRAERETHDRNLAAWEEATRSVREKMDELTKPFLEKKVEVAYRRFDDEIRAMMDKKPADRTAYEHQIASLAERQLTHERTNFNPLSALKDEAAKKTYTDLQAELSAFDHLKPAPLPPALLATDAKRVAPPNPLKSRRGEQDVPPGFLKILEPEPPVIEPLATTTGRRSELAAWITRPDNQLTTRTIVNRIWQFHFGRGLAPTPNDLGTLGGTPTHPELLDWLAHRFPENGWSVKKLTREILLSRTFQQTARRDMPAEYASKDPENLLLWRFPPRRLDAEQVRDSILAATGELDFPQGGPSQDAGKPIRSIYTVKKRNSQDELLRAMDAPANFISNSDRQSTTTPTQALFLLNSDWMLARAAALAKSSGGTEGAWATVMGREMSSEERGIVNEFLRNQTEYLRAEAEPEPEGPGDFRPGSDKEKLLFSAAADSPRETEDFTIETTFSLRSIDRQAAVKTLVSRWNGAVNTPSGIGWSLGVTGVKSRFSPNKLLLQMVGSDAAGAPVHDLANSDLTIQLNTIYQARVRVSARENTVTFVLNNLSKPGSPEEKSVQPIRVASGLSLSPSPLVIGGRADQAPDHQFDGVISAMRIASHEGRELFSWDPKRDAAETTWKWAGQTATRQSDPSRFETGSPQERLILSSPDREGDQFTIQAVITPYGVDSQQNVRTIASRWNMGKDNLESFGWSLCLTGEGSRYKPWNLIMQLVGQDENSNIAFEIVPSEIFLSPNTPHLVTARVDGPAQTVTFTVLNLRNPEAGPKQVTVKHRVRSGISSGQSQLAIGGLHTRLPQHQFDGQINHLRVTPSLLPDAQAAESRPDHWDTTPAPVLLWNAEKPLPPFLARFGKDGEDDNDPARKAFIDLCQMLLNSNEFLYLH